MSQERDVLNLTDTNNPLQDLDEKEYEAKLVEVLDRGLIQSRLSVDLPSEVHGEWVADDPISIAQKKAIGFKIDTEHAAGNALHSDATGVAKVGDLIFMTIPKKLYKVLESVKKRQYDKHHGVRDTRGETSVEAGFKADATRNETPAVNKGETREFTLRSLDT